MQRVGFGCVKLVRFADAAARAGLFRALPDFRQDISSTELRARAAAEATAAAGQPAA